jgi:phage FluMu gp28-like protein
VARPTKYKPEYAEQTLKLCRLGATDKELADFFQVNEDTINEWKKVHVEFSESIKGGKAQADAEVADKLFKRATGYEHKAVKISASPDGREHVTEYDERYPPDTTAAIFWLKNRRPDLWRDKTDHTIGNPDGSNLNLAVNFVDPPKK